MNYLKKLGLMLTAVTALVGLVGVTSASATTLEIKGVRQGTAVTLKASLAGGTSMVIRSQDGTLVDTCTTSSMEGSTQGSFSSAIVYGNLTSFTASNCSHTTDINAKGAIAIAWSGSTNGRLIFSGTQVTVRSTFFGTNLACSLSGNEMGTLTGKTSGQAVMDIRGTIDCGMLFSEVFWEGTYVVTSPEGLGVVE